VPDTGATGLAFGVTLSFEGCTQPARQRRQSWCGKCSETSSMP